MPLYVLSPPLSSLTPLTINQSQALRTFIEPDSIPNLTHCSQGKDRTGLVISLVLMILRVPPDAIDHDYRLSDGSLNAERQERLAELRVLGLSDGWIDTDPGMVPAVKAHMDTKYGGLDGYLDFIGFTEGERSRLRELLLC